MKLYQLFYLPNGWYTAVLGGFSGLISATLVDWASVSTSQLWESALVGVLASVVFIATMAAGNFLFRLRRGRWPVDA